MFEFERARWGVGPLFPIGGRGELSLQPILQHAQRHARGLEAYLFPANIAKQMLFMPDGAVFACAGSVDEAAGF
ncbi:MAG: hypothetical protein ACK569_01625, partial [Hyphomonadaceae bacterium]